MRYEAIWLVRFIATTSLLLGVFVVGYALGKHRATRWQRTLDVGSHGEREVPSSAFVGSVRRRANLFAPEVAASVDLRNSEHVPIRELPRASSGDRSS